MSKKVVIIDYELGNLFSVNQACKHIGIETEVSKNIDDIKQSDAIILPGVGAFKQAMQNMREFGLDKVLKEEALSGKPIMGVCLGMQLLFTKSEEFGSTEGLNIIEGDILRFSNKTDEERLVRIPQISWNEIYTSKLNWDHTPFRGLSDGTDMYFIHSYYASPKNADEILSLTNYAKISYCSSVIKDNIFATQFHPEKSGENGLSIYKNWAQINKII
jgi:glutamine amidotransferase